MNTEETLERSGLISHWKITRSLNDREVTAHTTSESAARAALRLLGVGQVWRKFGLLGVWCPVSA